LKNRKNILTAAVAVVTAALLAACGSTSSSTSSSSTPAASGGITAADPWVKSAKTGMTAAFVTLSNATGTEEVLVSATTPASPMVELHEMVMQDGAMVMQQKQGGIAVPANGSAVLEPGGNHIMLMGLSSEVKAGDQVPLTLTFASGLTLEIMAVGKDFAGADESYNPSPSMSGM
jgi:copper(I)-binding protein